VLSWVADHITLVSAVVGLAPAVATVVVILLRVPENVALLDDMDVFLDAVRAGHTDAAYARLTAIRRAAVSRPQFEALLAERPQLRGWQARRFPKVVVFGNEGARITCVLEAQAGRHMLMIGSRRHGERWEVDALRLAESEAFLGSVGY
jgi:hypothetical protein